MIPRRLALCNFMSYGEGPNVLDFSSWHVACMSGNNGHGKSAIFDAMTWALWGRCRARREDDVVRQGATNAEVEFEFALGQGIYRVVRKRALRRSTGQTTLELHVLHEGAWKAATGASVNETQAALTEMLRLSYDTFINSAFLMQGRADEFTVKPPNERKRVLGDILGLGHYDDMAERARFLARERDAEIKQLQQRLLDLDDEIAREPELRDEERTVEREIHQVTLAYSEASNDLRRLGDQYEELRRGDAALTAARHRQGELEQLLAKHRQRSADLEGFLIRCDALIDQAVAINAGYAELQAARAEIAEMDEAGRRLLRLNQRIHELERAISAAESAIREQVHEERHKAAQARGIAQRAPGLAEQVGEMTIEVARTAVLETTLSEIRGERDAGKAEIATLEAENAGLSKERTALRERLRMLKGADAVCPVCQSPLTTEERRRVETTYLAEGAGMKNREEGNMIRLAALATDLARLDRQEADTTAKLRGLQQTAGQLERLRADLREAQAAEIRASQAEQRAQQIEATLGTGQVAQAERVMLVSVNQQLAQLGYEEARHQALRAHCRDHLEQFQDQYDKLRTAYVERVPRQEQLRDTQDNVKRLDAEHGTLLREIDVLEEKGRGLAALQERIAACRGQVAALEMEQRKLQQRLGDIGGALRRIEACRAERAETALRHAALERDRSAYTDLGHAFGRQGIQAMIIDGVLPEIENAANEILNRMTDNSVHVQFSTQRQGATGNVIETLDIRISDSAGTRSYEMFSGGEAFRVNFAIRVALSRLLAGRAGASLHVLIVDEGFGSQDGPGRDRLIEAINSVSRDFQKIVVITHIEELKGYFPTQIDVIKGPGGSQISLSE